MELPKSLKIDFEVENLEETLIVENRYMKYYLLGKSKRKATLRIKKGPAN